MHNGITLSASLMCVDWLNAGAQLKMLDDSKIDFLHIDVIDGNFAPDFTMGTSVINVFREKTRLPFDYHLMIEEPSRLFNAFQFNQGDICAIHQEASRNLHRDLVSIRRMGVQVGIALSPGTPLEALEYVIEDANVILLMTVDPGYKGQPLIPQTLRKVEKLRKIIKDMQLDIQISVDGSVSCDYIPEMVSVGADKLVLGSSGLFRKDIAIPDALEKIYAAIDVGIKSRNN